MPRGGARPGAGRKPGSANRKTREIAEQAIKEGLTPLEVMLQAMRKHAAAGEWDRAAFIAKDAAPYIHPKLSSIEHAKPATTGTDAEAETDALIRRYLQKKLQDVPPE